MIRTEQLAWRTENAKQCALPNEPPVVGLVIEIRSDSSRTIARGTLEYGGDRTSLEVYEGHAVTHGKAVPWFPILAFVRGYFGIAEQDSPEAARDKIAVWLGCDCHVSTPSVVTPSSKTWCACF